MICAQNVDVEKLLKEVRQAKEECTQQIGYLCHLVQILLTPVEYWIINGILQWIVGK